MNIKAWKLWLFSSGCFLFASIMNLIDKKYWMGSVSIFLGITYLFLSITYYKKEKEPSKMEVPEDVLKNMDVELKVLLKEGERIKAIKQCRMVTGLGLKEAMEYVDLLGKEK